MAGWTQAGERFELNLNSTEEAARAQVIAATGSPSPVPFAPIEDAPEVYTHVGHDAQYGLGRRNGRSVRMLILHTTEGDGFLTAMAYAARRPEQVSSGAYVGASGEIGLGTPEADRSFTTGRWNDESLACEILGRAAWTDAQWRARSHQLEAIVTLLVDWCRRYQIPARWLSADQIIKGASQQSASPVQGTERGICDHLEANMAARLLGATVASTTHTDVGPALRAIIRTELIPEAARRLEPPAPPPSEEDDQMELIRVDGDPAVFLRADLTVVWVQSEAVRDALLADGTLKSATVRLVDRLTYKAYELHGPKPNAGPTTEADFARWVP